MCAQRDRGDCTVLPTRSPTSGFQRGANRYSCWPKQWFLLVVLFLFCGPKLKMSGMRGYLIVFVCTFWGTTLLNVFVPSLSEVWRTPVKQLVVTNSTIATSLYGNSEIVKGSLLNSTSLPPPSTSSGDRLRRELFWRDMIQDYFTWHDYTLQNNASVSIANALPYSYRHARTHACSHFVHFLHFCVERKVRHLPDKCWVGYAFASVRVRIQREFVFC